MSYIELSLLDTGLAATLVLILAGLTWWQGLGLSGRILVALVRLVVQLLLLGLVLDWVFGLGSPLLVLGIILLMVMVAGREVYARLHAPPKGWRGPVYGMSAMGVSAAISGAVVLAAIMRLDPVWDPQYTIPIIGMLLGNTMNGIALAMERLTSGAIEQQVMIESRLSLGHHLRQALAPIRRQALSTALIPTINGMTVAGIVSIPGMMTGQVLAGADPGDAARYQIMIFCAIAACTGFGSLIAVELLTRRLADHRGRLRLDRLKQPTSS